MAKHSFGQDLADAGIDVGAIADWFGHTDTKTTKVYTGGARLKRVSAAAEGRLGWGKTKKRAAVDVGNLGDVADVTARQAQLRARCCRYLLVAFVGCQRPRLVLALQFRQVA